MASTETRRMVLAAYAACEDKKAEDTRILELDPQDSGFTDFFLITSSTNERQSVAISDEIELRLKREFGIYPNSVEGRRTGEWILLDYVDFVVHVFLAERRAYYDIERLRNSAKVLDLAALKATLQDLTKKTIAVREKSKKAEATTAKKSPAKKAAKNAVAPKKAVAAPKTAAKKAPAKKTPAKKTSAAATAKKSAAKKATKKAAKKS